MAFVRLPHASDNSKACLFHEKPLSFFLIMVLGPLDYKNIQLFRNNSGKMSFSGVRAFNKKWIVLFGGDSLLLACLFVLMLIFFCWVCMYFAMCTSMYKHGIRYA